MTDFHFCVEYPVQKPHRCLFF